MQMWIFWFAIGIILIIAEMASFTFYLFWLGVGALAAAVVSLIAPDTVWLQIVIGSIVAVVLTYFTRPFTKKIQGAKGYKDAADELIGKQADVVEPILPGKIGIVRVGGDIWSATSDEALDLGEKAIVVSRSSTLLHVYKWKGE
ncbi:MAG TPA: NfeD family protein [Bacilli bacterium]